MVLYFKGVAHPPPDKQRKDPADLSAAEIHTTQMGKGGGTQLLYEHDPANCVGTVHASWESVNGSLRVAGSVRDPEIIKQMREGTLRGLSLGTDVTGTSDGKTILREQRELSLCEEPKRGGCLVDTIDGVSVLTRHLASKTRGEKSTLANKIVLLTPPCKRRLSKGCRVECLTHLWKIQV